MLAKTSTLSKKHSWGLSFVLFLLFQACQSDRAITPLKIEWKLEKNIEWNKRPAYETAFQLDVGRNFQSKETILRILDMLALYKINKFLLYLTEDEGFRQFNADWNQFINTVSQKEFPKFDKLNNGYRYRIPAPGIFVENDTVYMNTAYPGVEIRYTTDGAEPNVNSPLYEGPFFYQSKEIVSKCFNKQGRSGLLSHFTKELLK